MTEVIDQKDGTIIASSKEVEVKVDSNRVIYVKDNKQGIKTFRSINMKVPYGMSKDDKMNFVFALHNKIVESLSETDEDENNTNGETGIYSDMMNERTPQPPQPQQSYRSPYRRRPYRSRYY